MTFEELRREMFRHYGRGDHAAALEVVTRARGRFPERSVDLDFWAACLRSVTGDVDGAIDELGAAAAAGHWYGARLLADQDLDAARAHPEFAALADRFERRFLAHRREGAAPRIRGGEGTTALVALHGLAMNPLDTLATWSGAAPSDWPVVVLGGDEQHAPGRYGWTREFGEERALGQIRASVPPGRSIVLGGFSQGAGLAGHLALTAATPVDGLVMVAPTFTWWGMPVPGVARGVPLYVIAGDEDMGYQAAAALVAELTGRGLPAVLDTVPGEGHAYPADFRRRLERALRWIRSAGGP